MASENELPAQRHQTDIVPEPRPEPDRIAKSRWKRMLSRSNPAQGSIVSRASSEGIEEMKRRPEKWSMGVLNDTETDEVPGEYHSSHMDLHALFVHRVSHILES